MRRILIIGCPGSGKSTLARQMGEKNGLPVVHLDKFFWLDNWQEIDKAIFNQKLAEELQKPQWILDGNYPSSLQKRLEACDTAIFLDYPRMVCVLGILKRVFSSLGKTRPDMADNCPERLDLKFLYYAWQFGKKRRPKLLETLAQFPDKNIIILKSRAQARRFLDSLERGAK